MADVPIRHRPRLPAWPVADVQPTIAAKRPPASSRRIVARLIGAAVALLVAGGLLRFAVDYYRDHEMLTGLTADRTPVHLAIGDESLVIPSNMLRSPQVRAGGSFDHADLVFHWPDLDGYSDRYADAFTSGAPGAPIVYATIAVRDTPLDATARLDEVYTRFFVDKPVAGPAGLVGRHLSADSGYEGEVVFFQPSAPQPFVARCLSTATPEVPATCLRDINFGKSLSLLFRFDRSLLANWQQLDTGMRQLGSNFLVH